MHPSDNASLFHRTLTSLRIPVPSFPLLQYPVLDPSSRHIPLPRRLISLSSRRTPPTSPPVRESRYFNGILQLSVPRRLVPFSLVLSFPSRRAYLPLPVSVANTASTIRPPLLRRSSTDEADAATQPVLPFCLSRPPPPFFPQSELLYALIDAILTDHPTFLKRKGFLR